MDLDLSIPNNLDSSIMNFVGSGNRPIARGTRVISRPRILPFYAPYGYYNADGDMVMAAAEPVQVSAPASTPVFEPTAASQSPVTQAAPIYVSQPTLTSNQISDVPPMQNSSPTDVPPLPNSSSTPTYTSQDNTPPLVATYNAPTTNNSSTTTSTPTTTATTTSTTSTATSSDVPMTEGGFGGGGGMGGGGGEAPASSSDSAAKVSAPKVATTGMSKGKIFGILALLAIGGYIAYKNRAKLGF